MTLPDFGPLGDLAPGVYRAELHDVLARFGSAVGPRGRCTRDLAHVYELARRTGHLERFLVFGSYVTAKPDPNDVDIILVMDDNFRLETCPVESGALFDHAVAQARYGASVFWTRPNILIGETVDEFLAHWQVKRDKSRRGTVEVVP